MTPPKIFLTTVALVVVLLKDQINAQLLKSPCPRWFTYERKNETDRWYGTITLLSDTDLLDVWLRLTFDRTSLQLGNWFGQVETTDSKEYVIRKPNFELKAHVPQTFRFFLKYDPIQPAPTLQSFRLNGKLVCPEDIPVGSNSRDRVNTQFDTDYRDGLEFNTQDAVNTRFEVNTQDSVNTNSRDRVDTQYDTNSRDRVNNQFDTNSRDRVNSQYDTTSRASVLGTTYQDKTNINSRDRVNTQFDTNSRDRVNTQYETTSRASVLGTTYQDRTSTNSRDRVNAQLDTNSRDRVNTQYDTTTRGTAMDSNYQDKTNTNFRDRVNTNSRDTTKIYFRDEVSTTASTNSRDRVNTHLLNANSRDDLDTNSRDAVNTQSNTNYRDRVNTQLSTNSHDRVNTHLDTNSWYTTNTPFIINSRDVVTTNSRDRGNTQSGTTSRNMNRDDICGTVIPQARPLIAYGEITHEGEFPWHAALYRAKETRLTYFCGASLISKNYIITAAHCVVKAKSKDSLKAEELIVQLGKYNLKRFSVGFQDRQVSEIIAHPQFNVETYRNDIALIKLSAPANITEYVRPVCLWQESSEINTVINRLGKVVGWGYDETGKISEELMQAKMPVVPIDKCISSYPDFYTRFTSSNSYCAGFANGTSPCNGDAGGGMVFPIPNANRYSLVWQLRGLISILPAFQNQLLCDVTHYAIFTDVAKYLDWIVAAMK